jgi:hypothetical protein
MGKIVNLNIYRKRQKRASDLRRASGNRAKFGRDKAEVSRDRALKARANKELDDHKRE